MAKHSVEDLVLGVLNISLSIYTVLSSLRKALLLT